MERQQYLKEERTVNYRGEDYRVRVGVFCDPETGELYTTTASDQEWWEDLRDQYLFRHPEAMIEFSKVVRVEEVADGEWRASWSSPDGYVSETRTGRRLFEALYNLYICLSI